MRGGGTSFRLSPYRKVAKVVTRLSPAVVEARVVDALRGDAPGGQRWTVARVARAADLPMGETGEAVRRLRFAGKIDFTNLVLSPSMRVSGEAALPPAAAPDLPPATTRDGASPAGAVAPDDVPAGDDAALAETPSPRSAPAESPSPVKGEGLGWRDRIWSPRTVPPIEEVRRFGDRVPAPSDAIRHCQAEMPALWARCVAAARDEGVLPGELMLRAIGAGLDCLEDAG